MLPAFSAFMQKTHLIIMAVSAGNFSFDQINSKEEAPMGKADAAVRNWLSDKRRFADLFNGVIFSGREVVTADELEEQKRRDVRSDTRQGRWNKIGPEIQGYCHEMGRKNGSDVARSGIAG